MKFISTWTVLPGKFREAAQSLGEYKPAEGVTVLGRWHKADCSGGFMLFETNNPDAAYEEAMYWADILEFRTVPVIEEKDAGQIVQKLLFE